MSAEGNLEKLLQEARGLEKRKHTVEEERDLRARARPIIKNACTEQYKQIGAVLTPVYCLACDGCVIKTIVEGVMGRP